jgi:hypothetical protein
LAWEAFLSKLQAMQQQKKQCKVIRRVRREGVG